MPVFARRRRRLNPYLALATAVLLAYIFWPTLEHIVASALHGAPPGTDVDVVPPELEPPTPPPRAPERPPPLASVETQAPLPPPPPPPAESAPPPPPLGEHEYRDDGLLAVNPDGAHPIPELIRRAEAAWAAKLARASTTLAGAVAEYRRRYARAPPRGFDRWWAYVQRHNVSLPDEYDQITRDLEPFLGFAPADVQRVARELERKFDSYTLGKGGGGPVAIVATALPPGPQEGYLIGAHEMMGLLREVEDELPDFRATFSPHDGPNRLSDFAIKEMATRAARAGTPVNVQRLPQAGKRGWVSACAPTSPARRTPLDLDRDDALPPLPAGKTFIHDHARAMDPCLHPALLALHGQFLTHGAGPAPQRPMVPEFSYCSTPLHHDISFPYPLNWVADLPAADNPEWDDRAEERLLWRGSNTGMYHGDGGRWRAAHRDRLVFWANAREGAAEVLLPAADDGARVGEPEAVRRARLGPALLDVAFAGAPVMCDPGVCAEMEEAFVWRDYMGAAEAGRYRYVLDVDGNGWSSRFKRLITSHALVFKSTVYPEWYTDRVQPWVHYVPVQVDLADVADALLWFRGPGVRTAGAHEDAARRIARAGREWSRAFWRREDMVAYMYRLLLEWARVMADDRAAMGYEGEGAGAGAEG